MKTYSPAYWVKHALRFQSKPEEVIARVVIEHAAQSETGVAFEGTPHELLNLLYIEWRKQMRSVHGCLFPTPVPVARDLAQLACVGAGDIVFDPGCGLGNLLFAARECGAQAFGVETQYWLPPLTHALGLDIQRGDYLDGYKPAPFTHVLTNPPYGNLWGVSDSTQAFLERLATQCTRDIPVAAILPLDYVRSERPKARVATLEQFDIEQVIHLPPDTFKPLTGMKTDMVLMRCKRQAPAPSRMSISSASIEVPKMHMPTVQLPPIPDPATLVQRLLL